jgi:DNA anti-recombination protein RmuC
MAPPQGSDLDVAIRVATIDKQVDGMYTIFQRIEQSIEKMTETNSSIKELLAVHEQRLQQQESGVRTFYDVIEKRKDETDRGFEVLRREIKEEIKEQYVDLKSTVEQLRQGQVDFTNRIEQKVTTLQNSSDTEFKSLEDRVRKLEAWRWVLVGGGLVVGFIVGHFADLSHLLH